MCLFCIIDLCKYMANYNNIIIIIEIQGEIFLKVSGPSASVDMFKQKVLAYFQSKSILFRGTLGY